MTTPSNSTPHADAKLPVFVTHIGAALGSLLRRACGAAKRGPEAARVLFTIARLLSLAVVTGASADEGVRRATIQQILAAPSLYDGKVVRVDAYAHVQFEGNELCPAQKSEHCLWLQYDDGPWKTEEDLARYHAAQARWQPLHGKRISVVGTFNLRNTGHLGSYPGAIEHITSVETSAK